VISHAGSAFCFIKNIACGAFFSKKILFLIIRECISFQKIILSTNLLVVKMIWTQILSDHNDTICTKQQLQKFQITNPLSNQTSWDTNRTTPFRFQNLLETTYVNTCNIIVTNTRLISVLFRLHAVSSRLLLNLWHSNGPEPKVHFFLLESKSRLSPVSCPSYDHALVWHTIFLQQ